MTVQEPFHDYTLKVIRLLVADLVQQFNGGHPGGAMGMAAIGVSLWKYVMKYAPSDPNFFNRDRFVLSNGHTCLFQYIFLHLTGYKHMTMSQLKTYHSADLNSYCPGHPENEHPGIELTTGALGQGISNSVGLAIAGKNLQATYNKPEFPVISSQIFCMVGDACLQEGVALESISFAGHLGLGNLTVIYDNNQITCDGSVDLTNTENIKDKFLACNWEVLEISEGDNVNQIVEALEYSKTTEKPTIIIVNTRIGIDTAVEGTAVAHGAAFGQSEVDKLHELYQSPEKFYVPSEVYDFFKVDESFVDDWNKLFADYQKAYPESGEELARRIKGELPDWKHLIPKELPSSATASRKASGLVFNNIAKNVNSFMVGTADLSPSVNMAWADKKDFQNPKIKTQCGINGDYSGRYIHYGIREHAMASISNGIAAYNKGTFIPVTSSFFMFYLYAAPGVRYGALSEFQVIHVATHDSIGIGEDGPTHHPIELAALYRSMPNMLYIRPCDNEEVAGAWEAAIDYPHSTIISLSRHNLKQYPELSKRDKVKLGAYVFSEVEDPALNILVTGSEMQFAMEAQEILAKKGIKANVISFPCQRLFDNQPLEYKRSILKQGKLPSVIIEAYAVNGWEKYATAGINMKTFGKSLPGPKVYEYFGYNSEVIADKIDKYYSNWSKDEDLKYEFQEL
ncbi:transketolase 1 [[Candida] jaroonii]|uniref:Transketolase 1 n=1 Tax=[Candida] jaroonii TaxID=467808 RepID=A0ACA9Y5G7_9ASCO|nr:transketolase 1 [[Candida] jaroonii]